MRSSTLGLLRALPCCPLLPNSLYLPSLTFIHRLPREQEVFKLRAEVARLKEQRRHSMEDDEEALPAIRDQLLMLQEIVCLWELHACRFARTRW